ncbi:MAG: hypothetical protein QOJ27_2761 [Sphingomonadales bacterium]|nr:hypothetical protein [Sphingomonadales bacterium]
MIIDHALAVWLGSESARASTQAAMGVLAADIAAMPAIAALGGAVPGARDADSMLALARTFLEDDETLGQVVAAAVATAAADPMCRPPLRASRNDVQDGLLLFSHPLLTLQLAVMNADALAIKRGSGGDPAPISFTGQRSLFRFLKGGRAVLSIWEARPSDDGFSVSDAAPCRLRGRRRLEDGDMIEFDGRREAFVVDSAESDLVYLFASTTLDSSPVATDYDCRSLELIAASSTDDVSSRVQMMLALLRALGRRDAAALFAERLRARHFHARWQAMRELLALDAELALPHLRRMAGCDPHPEVRAAAAETLAVFFPEAHRCPA